MSDENAAAPAAPPALNDPRTLKHIIIWRDPHIGDKAQYVTLKRAFISNIDPSFGTRSNTTEEDLTNLACRDDADTIRFGEPQSVLLCCTSVEECCAAFEENRNKKIFFITSGKLGREILIRIMKDYKALFTDSVTEEPCRSIYIFCGSVEKHADLVRDHKEHVRMVNHEADLLERVTMDAAAYYSTLGERAKKDGEFEEAEVYLAWSAKLSSNYETLKKNSNKSE